MGKVGSKTQLLKLLVLVVVVSGTSYTAEAQKSATGTFLFSVRSFWTNYAVAAKITVRSRSDGQTLSGFTDDTGRLRLELPVGEYEFAISAREYEPMETHFPSEAGTSLPVTVVLHPLQEPEELKTQEALVRSGSTLISGWAVDADTGKPLAGVRISVDQALDQGITNARGYFTLSVPAPRSRIVAGTEMPGLGTLIAELVGYKKVIAKNIFLPDGAQTSMNFELQAGVGTDERNYRHKLDPEDNPQPQP